MAAAALAQLALLLGALGAAVLVAGARRAARRRAARRTPPVTRRPIQVVAADLRRLARHLALVPAGAAQVRRQALLAAYDHVLVEVAEQLEVPHRLDTVPRGPARDAERQRLLAALEDVGLAVHA
ncbi:MAG: hypothetical protein ACXVXS_08220 [Blastococcus sp.]